MPIGLPQGLETAHQLGESHSRKLSHIENDLDSCSLKALSCNAKNLQGWIPLVKGLDQMCPMEVP
jgi:hypothetical protein